MTQKERIEQLEQKVRELETRLAAQESRPQYFPWPQPSPPVYPWQSPWAYGNTSERTPEPPYRVMC